MLNGIGTLEIAIAAGILLLVLGGKKIPELARGLGQGIREFKDSLAGTARARPPADP